MIAIRYYALGLALAASTIYAQELDAGLLEQIKTRMNQNSNTSWEMGTRAQTLTELDFPMVSVFSPDYLSPTPPSARTLDPVIDIARDAVNTRTNKQIVPDGSAADPASLGVAVLLGDWTNAPGANWAVAAKDQLDLLLYETPRSRTGAISHRTEYPQLWSDFVYMVPPFLAYYGVVTSNVSLVTESFNQIRLYRDALVSKSGSTKGLWKHIVAEPGVAWTDEGFWSTGNGWAAAGMLRVLATIKHSPYASRFSKEMDSLTEWIDEIHIAMFKYLPNNGVFPNYADNPSTFPDAASTALLASTVYRLVTLTGKGTRSVPDAERARTTLYSNGGREYFDPSGWLSPVVNPKSFGEPGTTSPEGQAFALQMDNNWKEWKKAGSQTSTAVPAPYTSSTRTASSSSLSTITSPSSPTITSPPTQTTNTISLTDTTPQTTTRTTRTVYVRPSQCSLTRRHKKKRSHQA